MNDLLKKLKIDINFRFSKDKKNIDAKLSHKNGLYIKSILDDDKFDVKGNISPNYNTSNKEISKDSKESKTDDLASILKLLDDFEKRNK